MNLDLVFAMVGETVENETVATFYDVCDVFDPNSGHFSTLPSGLKVMHAFKAKTEAFRERFCEKVEKGPFSHFGVGKSLRDETRFLKMPRTWC